MNNPVCQQFDLTGRVAVITGAAKGIGKGIAEALSGQGVKVVIADVDVDESELCAKAITNAGGHAAALSCDVSDEDSVRLLIDSVIELHGKLDIVVNNAAVYPMSPLSEMSTELWDHVLGINLRGTFLISRLAFPHLVTAGANGRLVNISSIDTWKTYVGMGHYDASKGGIEAFTRSCALELAPHGATANVIAPGAVKTPGSLAVRSNFARERGDKTTDAIDEEFRSRIPLGRWATPQDIGLATTLIAAPAAGYITGQTIYVDGGLKLTL